MRIIALELAALNNDITGLDTRIAALERQISNPGNPNDSCMVIMGTDSIVGLGHLVQQETQEEYASAYDGELPQRIVKNATYHPSSRILEVRYKPRVPLQGIPEIAERGSGCTFIGYDFHHE